MHETQKSERSEAECYLLEIVEPTIQDFEANPASRRHAFLASVALTHTLDYIYGCKGAHSKRDEFRKVSKDFSIVDRVAHAFKHVQSGNENNQNFLPLNAKEMTSRPPGAIGSFAIGLSRLGDENGGVTLTENVNIDILHALKEAVAFLRTQLP